MRPDSLRVSGFGALRDPVEVDFSDSDFFALVGPTGSGKSTIIDAICFALYGAIPRYGEQAAASALSSNAPEARLEFGFRCGAERYRIVRVVRRKGAPKAQLDRLDSDGQLVETLASSATEVKECVVDLVGLTFSQFTKCVVLPQGQFFALLHETSGERTKLLTRLLDHEVYSRIAQAAGARAAELAREVEVARRTLLALDVVDVDAIDLAAERVDELREVERGSVDLVEHDAAQRLEIEHASQAADQLKQVLSALVAVQIPVDLDRASADHATALADLASASDALARASLALDAAAATVAERGDAAEPTRGLATHDELATLRGELELAERTVLEATTADAAAKADVDAAAQALAECSAQHESLRDRHLAHAVVAQLAVGQPCPVCEQTVTALPLRAAPPELDAARAAIGTAQQHLATATARANQLAGELAAASRTRDDLSIRRDDTDKRAATLPTREELKAVLDAIAEADAAHRAARQHETQARRTESAARARRDEVTSAQQGHRTALLRERETLAALALAPLPDSSDELGAAWTALATWAHDQHQRCETERDAALRRAAHAARRRNELVAPLRERLESFGVETNAGADLHELTTAVRRAVAKAEARHAHLVESRVRHAELSEQAEHGERRAQTARALAALLDNRHFQAWLMRRAVHDLAARATVHLADLSNGRYSLTIGDKDEFCVIDHANADDIRSAKSLSGGETFQASLALALALAEQVAEFSTRGTSALESIFLDEGFGTLDPEALDAVAGTIEQLGSGERVVGLVTHVPGLAERVPVRFRVSNDGRTSSVEREVG